MLHGLCLLLITAAAAAQSRPDSTWRDHGAATDSAAARQKWDDYLYHVRILDSALNRSSRTTVALARGYARTRQPGPAIGLLREFAASGLTRDLDGDSTFNPIRSLPAFTRVVAQVSANRKREIVAQPGFTLRDSGFIAEDLAWDGRRERFLFSGIRGRKVILRDASGQERDFLTEKNAGPLWAVMGLGIDSARDVLWVSTAADDRIPGLPAGAPPRASVLRVRLEDGQVEHRFDFNDGRPHEPGDLRVAPDGAVIVSDGRFGAVYRIQPRTDRLDTLLAEGSLTGPQEPAVSPDGKRVLVPDYAAGIAIVSGGTTRWLGHARSIPLNGIDGLLWAGPRVLFAVQNGVAPVRVLRLTLSPGLDSVVTAETVAQGSGTPDPTHGVVVGSSYYFIAQAGWESLDERGEPKAGVPLPKSDVARVPLGR